MMKSSKKPQKSVENGPVLAPDVVRTIKYVRKIRFRVEKADFWVNGHLFYRLDRNEDDSTSESWGIELDEAEYNKLSGNM